MPTHKQHTTTNEVYFITFTCHKWLPLFEITSLYNYFDKWFDYLTTQHANLLGYVVMPNHFHGLIFLDEKSTKSINSLVSNGKRFLAYEIVNRLKKQNQYDLLNELANKVNLNELAKGKKHQIFRPSFDAKVCINRKMAETKLEYIHHNPVKGKWNLAEDWTKYKYSSAAFYMNDKPSQYLCHYKDLI